MTLQDMMDRIESAQMLLGDEMEDISTDEAVRVTFNDCDTYPVLGTMAGLGEIQDVLRHIIDYE